LCHDWKREDFQNHDLRLADGAVEATVVPAAVVARTNLLVSR
jgi:hypothetical protein